MTEPPSLGFFARLVLAWIASFRVLFDARFAAAVARLRAGGLALEGEAQGSSAKPKRGEPEEPAVEPKKPIVLREATPDAALQLLALLQREGRFIDFLEEDVSSFEDAQIGAAARVVHDGCKRALDAHLPLTTVRDEEEGSLIVLEDGFDARAIRLTGNVSGRPPFRGTLAHRGWRVREVKLPKMTEGHDASIVAPAEVEV